MKDKIPLKLPTLKMGNKVTEQTPSLKFLGVMLDENVSWKYHIKKYLFFYVMQGNFLMKHF